MLLGVLFLLLLDDTITAMYIGLYVISFEHHQQAADSPEGRLLARYQGYGRGWYEKTFFVWCHLEHAEVVPLDARICVRPSEPHHIPGGRSLQGQTPR